MNYGMRTTPPDPNIERLDEDWTPVYEHVAPHPMCCDECKQARADLEASAALAAPRPGRRRIVTWREKTVIRILLIIALMVNEDGDLARALRDLGNHIAHSEPKPDPEGGAG